MKQSKWVALLCVLSVLFSLFALTGCDEKAAGTSDAASADAVDEVSEGDADVTTGEGTTTTTETPTTTTTTKKPTGTTAPTTSKYDTMIYRFDFSKPDGSKTEYRQIGESTFRDGEPLKVGDKVTISFEYCSMGPTEVRFGSDRADQKWTDNPDYNFEVLQKQGEAPHRDTYTWTFTATENDVKYGTIRWWFKTFDPQEGRQFYDFYVWNFKVTKNGGPNIIRYDVYSQNGANRLVTEVNGNADGIEPPTSW